MKCPSCKSQFLFIEESGGNFVRCRKCNYNGKYIAPTYENYHTKKYPKEITRTLKNDPMLEKLIKTVGFNNTQKVIDYGCGTGDYTNYIKSIVKEIIGIDIDTTKAKEKFPETNFININFESSKLEFPDNSIDVIYCVNTIEHIYKYEEMLIEFKRVLKKGGKLFLTTFDSEFFLHQIHYDSTHMIEWTKTDFENLLSKHFKILESFRYGSFFNYMPLNKIIVKLIKPELCILCKKI